ncbi:hypothetical protein SAMN06295960_4036 [Paenibacillus aquistagni]|uniref:Uncharacterized protein n=1 Tax=Paenibacillus aquistagni TaxID=1852522 RepID=A0A1X7LQY2_9BACL|nr:hypothetical protein SAMN06295960_4036 [Paenibacillus aquistagni]
MYTLAAMYDHIDMKQIFINSIPFPGHIQTKFPKIIFPD